VRRCASTWICWPRLGGLVIIADGAALPRGVPDRLLAREARFSGGGKPATLSGAYVMGLAFAFGWTPCIGPVLGAVLGVAASRETVSAGAMLLAAYSLGLAVPFWIAALFSERFMRFTQRFRSILAPSKRSPAHCWCSPASCS
jgi:cytochrome c-type biogenesis protein